MTKTDNSKTITRTLESQQIPDHKFKIEDETLEVEADEVSQDSPAGPASFGGKLSMSDFAFTPETASDDDDTPRSLRRSARSSARPEEAVRTPSLKRKSSSSSSRPTQLPSKRSRKPSGYAPPSTYAHLKPLTDVIAPNLLCLFVGLNPGVQTSIQGHAYAHPSNLFWRLLHSSGLTTRRCHPSEDGELPRLFSLGNTNIVSRPTKNGSELSKKEMDESVGVLEDKVRKWRPESVCIVGKSIWESIWRARHGKAIKKEEFKYGWQSESENMGRRNQLRIDNFKNDEGSPEKSSGSALADKNWKGARVFVATSTSGLAASLSLAEKEAIWRELGVWVEQRRNERGLDIKEEAS